MTAEPVVGSEGSGDDSAPEVGVEFEAGDEPPSPRPYMFDQADVVVAVQRLDAAYAAAGMGRRWHHVVDALRGGPPSEQMCRTETALDHALQRIVQFHLRLAAVGRPPGCRLGPQSDTETSAFPGRLSEVPEAELRLWEAMAGRLEHPAARARLNDLLAECRRRPVRVHAQAAVDAYLQFSDLDQCEGVSFTVAESLVRAWELCRRFGMWDRHPHVHTALLVAAGRELATGAHTPGIVMPMMEAAAAPPVRRQPPEATATSLETPDLDALIEDAITAYPEDYLLARTMDLARRRAQSEEDRAAIDARQGMLLLQRARDAEGLIRQHRLETAIRFARQRGLSELEGEATRELQQITVKDLGLQSVSVSMWLPRDAAERYLAEFTRSSLWTNGLTLFLNSDCPTGSYDALVQQERELAETSILRRLFRQTHLTREGRPTWTTSTDAQASAAEIARIAGFHAEQHGRLLAQGLARMADRYELPDEDTLTQYLSRDTSVHVRLSRSLAKGLELFWRGEYEASAHLIYPKIEAAARALLLELDEPIYRVQIGSDPGGYGMLHGLLTALQDTGMDPDWIYFIKWLLLGNPGANLRNDLAHGLVLDPGPIHTALVLRAAALMIGLVAPEPDEGTSPFRGRDDALAIVRRPIAQPVPWPSRGGQADALRRLVSAALRKSALLLDAAAGKLAP